ncbi:unnamed protein product [Polarella glacialis]|nr:unnamed protein product [Polarella glacialis]
MQYQNEAVAWNTACRASFSFRDEAMSIQSGARQQVRGWITRRSLFRILSCYIWSCQSIRSVLFSARRVELPGTFTQCTALAYLDISSAICLMVYWILFFFMDLSQLADCGDLRLSFLRYVSLR